MVPSLAAILRHDLRVVVLGDVLWVGAEELLCGGPEAYVEEGVRGVENAEPCNSAEEAVS